jgi:hypothetical protein
VYPAILEAEAPKQGGEPLRFLQLPVLPGLEGIVLASHREDAPLAFQGPPFTTPNAYVHTLL